MTFEREAAASPARAKAAARRAAPAFALQRTAGNRAVGAILTRALLQRQVGWTGVDAASWNAGPREVGGVTRIPVEGIPGGHASGVGQDDKNVSIDDPETGVWQPASKLTPEAAGGAKTGRAIVLIPKSLPKGGTVEVLFHLHGQTPGGRGRGAKGTGAPEDVSVARIAQQIEASGRPMIAILPQGISGMSGFFANPWKFDLDKYIDDTLALVPAEHWPEKTQRKRGGVVLSAHSGGGDVLAAMMQGGRVPATVEGLFLFDALHGWGPDETAALLKRRLDGELAQLHKIATPDDQLAWLQKSGFRFRGFAGSKSYQATYKKLEKPLQNWFAAHAEELGGVDSCVYRTLRANYLDQAVVPSGTSHEKVVGTHLQGALDRKPPDVTGCKPAAAQPVAKQAPAPARPPAKKKAGVLARAPTAGWAGARKGTPNFEPRTTKGTSIRRVPVKGIASGLGGAGNGLVLIPEWLPAEKTVEVLFHLHGHQWPGYGIGYERAEDETVFRIEQALDQFSADKKRPIIAVLPHGGSLSEFGKDADLDADTYVQQAVAAVPPDQWPSGAAPQLGGVILSGHSGAGGRFASMFGTSKMPGRLKSFLSFDTINGKTGQKVSEIETGNEYKQHVAFILAKLDADLRLLKGGGRDEDLAAKLALEGFRFRAFYTGSPHLKGDDLDPKAFAGYADRYFRLKQNVDAWFDAHEAELGGKGSKVYTALRANYTIQPAGTEHMQMMGGVQERGGLWRHENLRAALGSV